MMLLIPCCDNKCPGAHVRLSSTCLGFEYIISNAPCKKTQPISENKVYTRNNDIQGMYEKNW